MKFSSPLVALIVFSLTACGQKAAEAPASPAPVVTPVASLPVEHSILGTSKMTETAPEPPLTQKAQVLSVINVEQYTYLEVMQDSKSRWLATIVPSATAAKKGDAIQFDNGTLMSNFTSKVLNRTFPSITFVGRVVISK